MLSLVRQLDAKYIFIILSHLEINRYLCPLLLSPVIYMDNIQSVTKIFPIANLN
jgi:hypothetical protein